MTTTTTPTPSVKAPRVRKPRTVKVAPAAEQAALEAQIAAEETAKPAQVAQLREAEKATSKPANLRQAKREQAAKKASSKPTTDPAAEGAARVIATSDQHALEDMVTLINNLKAQLEDAYIDRAALLTRIAEARSLTNAQISAILGVTPMAALNMRKRVRKV